MDHRHPHAVELRQAGERRVPVAAGDGDRFTDVLRREGPHDAALRFGGRAQGLSGDVDKVTVALRDHIWWTVSR